MNATSLSNVKGSHGTRALVIILLASGHAAARPDLYSNGPFITHTGMGAGGANLSAVQTALLNNSFGASIQLSPNNDRAADDFILSSAGTVTSVVVYAFQTNANITTPTFTSVNLRIWSGRPGDPGAQIVFGDTTTNRLLSAAWTGCYRARDDSPTNTQRPIFAVEASVNPPLALAAGTYWLDWQASGTLSAGPNAAIVVIPGQQGAPGANARWKQGSASNWINYIDSGNLVIQDLAFIVRGETGGGPAPCYPNCDASTNPPVLSANDFQCFLNSFVAGESYANCDNSTNNPVLSANDFQCFLNSFVAGCN